MKKNKCKVFSIVLVIIFTLCGCLRRYSYEEVKLNFALEERNVQGVMEVLRDGKTDLEKLPKPEFTNYKNKDRRALAIAMNDGGEWNTEIIRLLIEAGADVNNTQGCDSYLMTAAEGHNLEICKMLIDAGADVNAVNKDGGDSVIKCLQGLGSEYEGVVYYGECDTWEMMQFLLDNGANIDSRAITVYLDSDCYIYGGKILAEIEKQRKDIKLSKTLKYAVTGENEELLKVIEGEELSSNEKKQVLFQAAAHCNVEVLRKLKEKGYDFSQSDQSKQTLLHLAAKYNDASVVSYLLQEGMNIEAISGFYKITPLTSAVIGGKEENVKILLNAGARWQRNIDEGIDVWKSACEAGVKNSINILLDNNFKPTKEEIIQGYEVCNEDTGNALLKNSIPYDYLYETEGIQCSNFVDLIYNNPDMALEAYRKYPTSNISSDTLSAAVESGNDELAKILIDDAGKKGISFMGTPLESAVLCGELELAEYLVEHGADVNCTIITEVDADEYTVMHQAACRPSRDILEYLVKKGGDIKRKNSEGKTPYDIAKDANMKENMKLLK